PDTASLGHQLRERGANRARGREPIGAASSSAPRPQKECPVPYLDEIVDELNARLDLYEAAGIDRSPSRYAGEGASAEHVRRVANLQHARVVPRTITARNRSTLATTMAKALAEGTPSAGGYLVPV